MSTSRPRKSQCRHAEITVADGHATVKDLGSSNGTYSDDELVRKSGIKHGQRLRFGNARFLVSIFTIPDDEGDSELDTEPFDQDQEVIPTWPGLSPAQSRVLR